MVEVATVEQPAVLAEQHAQLSTRTITSVCQVLRLVSQATIATRFHCSVYSFEKTSVSSSTTTSSKVSGTTTTGASGTISTTTSGAASASTYTTSTSYPSATATQPAYPAANASSCGAWELVDNVCCPNYCLSNNESESCTSSCSGGCGTPPSSMCKSGTMCKSLPDPKSFHVPRRV